jgi:16S rRNA (guanine966-N2)-methyltransferase
VSLRVIAGEARGRILQGPRSRETRPTSDLVRGAIFSMLEARGASFTRVLDLFAGTGALGIEALSRGAEWTDFVERDRAACAIISTNLQRTRFQSRARVFCTPLPAGLARVQGPYGLVFLDPPYGYDDVEELFDRLAGQGLLDDETTIVYEHDRRTMPPKYCGPLPSLLTRRHGSTAFTLYRAAEATVEGNEGA